MIQPSACATEFQSRRKATWRAIRWWLLIAAVCIISIVALLCNAYGPLDDIRIKDGLILMLVTVVCGLIINFNVRRLYRCPRCNSVPVRGTPGWRDEFGREARDVLWNPLECPTCGARLR